MKIVLVAGKKHGLACFEDLVARGHQILAVFGRRDEPYEPINYFDQLNAKARGYDIPFYSYQNLNTPKCLALLQHLQPHLMIVIKWRTLIRREIYSVPTKGCVVLHDSLLPKYRGFAPTVWAMINGERETGATLFFASEQADAGPIVGQEVVPIGPHDFIGEVEDRVVQAYLKLLREHLPAIERGTVRLMPQDESQATYTCARTPDDNRIDWKDSAWQIYNLVRAVAVLYPAAFTYLGSRKIYVRGAELIATEDRYVGRVPGRVVRIEPGIGVQVLAGTGTLRLTEVQPDGEAIQNAAELVGSVRLRFG